MKSGQKIRCTLRVYTTGWTLFFFQQSHLKVVPFYITVARAHNAGTSRTRNHGVLAWSTQRWYDDYKKCSPSNQIRLIFALLLARDYWLPHIPRSTHTTWDSDKPLRIKTTEQTSWIKVTGLHKNVEQNHLPANIFSVFSLMMSLRTAYSRPGIPGCIL